MDWTLAGSVIITGLTVVFVVLILLWWIVALLGKTMSALDSKAATKIPAPVPAAPAPAQADGLISDEEMAVITAAGAAVRGNHDFTIVDVRRAGGN